MVFQAMSDFSAQPSSLLDESDSQQPESSMELQHPFVLRALQPSDFHKGYLQLLEQLTKVGNVSEEEFTSRVEQLQKLGDNHNVAVVEDVDRQLIVATGTLLVELKFARNCGKVGHVEDVVVDQSTRSKRLGQRTIYSGEKYQLVDFLDHLETSLLKTLNLYRWNVRVVTYLRDVAKEIGCYKVILDCSKENMPFYEKCGFYQKELQMAHYF